MLSNFLSRIVSYGIINTMDQFEANRIRRINLFYLILILLLFTSILFAVFTRQPLNLVRDGGVLAGTLLIYFLVPPATKTGLNSTLVLIIVALLLFSAFLVDSKVSAFVVLAFILIYPLAALSVNGKSGLLTSFFLGIIILIFNSVPGITSHIHLEPLDLGIFMTGYFMILLISHHIDRSNRLLVLKLNDSRSPFQGPAGSAG